MEPEFFLQVVLLSVLLFTGSTGQVDKKLVYRYNQQDRVNLDHEDQDLRDDSSDHAEPKLAFDEGSPVQPKNDGPPYRADKPPQGSSVNDQPATYPQSGQRFFYRVVPDQNSQTGDRPIIFPMKPRPQMPVPQSSPHPYGANPRTNSFRHPSNRPQVYPGHPFGQYGANKPVNNEQQGFPPGQPPQTQPPNIPVRNNQWVHTNPGPVVDNRNQMNAPPREELSIKARHHGRRRPVPRYVVHSNNGYMSNRYSISRLAYDPHYGLWKPM